MENKIITFSILIFALAAVYYLLIYVPQQRQLTIQREDQVRYINAQQHCLDKYSAFIDESNKTIQKGLDTCPYTGVCTRAEFLAQTGIEDPLDSSYKANYLSKCMGGYGFVSH